MQLCSIAGQILCFYSLYYIITFESDRREQNIVTIGSPQKRTRSHGTNRFLTAGLKIERTYT